MVNWFPTLLKSCCLRRDVDGNNLVPHVGLMLTSKPGFDREINHYGSLAAWHFMWRHYCFALYVELERHVEGGK